MKINKTYKFRMYPNKIQEELINKTIGSSRFAYNHMLKRIQENKEYYQVDRYYVSSQICSRCGNIKKEMKDINKREYECENCGLMIDRDLNASINIMLEGLFKEYRYE